MDTTTGLFYFRNRDYSPTLGRWVTMDPIGYQSGTNLYNALYNNPVVRIDFTGLEPPILEIKAPGKVKEPVAGNDGAFMCPAIWSNSGKVRNGLIFQIVTIKCNLDDVVVNTQYVEDGKEKFQTLKMNGLKYIEGWEVDDAGKLFENNDFNSRKAGFPLKQAGLFDGKLQAHDLVWYTGQKVQKKCELVYDLEAFFVSDLPKEIFSDRYKFKRYCKDTGGGMLYALPYDEKLRGCKLFLSDLESRRKNKSDMLSNCINRTITVTWNSDGKTGVVVK